MGPTALQARIAAFEALNNGDDSSLKSLVSAADDNDAPSSPRSPTAADTQASVIDLKDWVIEDRPSLSSSSSLTSSPAAAARLSPPVPSRPTPSPRSSNAPVPPPRIQVGTPPRQRSPVSRPIPLAAPTPAPAPALAAPPLPPRKSSSPTCTTAASAAAKRKPVVPASSSPTSPPLSSASSNMLMVPQSEHSYPPDGSRMSRGHAQASSISSFHSISLSSDAGSASDSATSPYLQTFPIEREDDEDDSSSDGNDDIDSLNESFENVSTPSNSSYAPSLPSTLLRAGKPPPPLGAKPASRFSSPVPSTPRLPPRSPSGSSTPPTQPSTPSGYARRVPPPPPPPLTSSQPGTSAGPLPYTPRQRARSNSRAPSVRSSIQSNSTTTTTTTATLSDRSSILSRTTSLSSFSQTSTTKAPSSSSTTSTSRAGIRLPPIPPPVRARYDALFTANIRARILAQQRAAGKPTHLGVPGPKRRANAGWRGLSVDLIPTDNAALLEDATKDRERAESDGGAEEDVVVPADARIPAGAVKRMWALSRLDRARLREIWEECRDPATTTATPRDKAGAKDGLDREAFARGMWRIDEELRRAAVTGSARRGTGAGAKAYRRAR